MYCTQCGTQNAAGASTCKECGAALKPAPGTGVAGGRRCGMCGTGNAPDATFCAQCGARVRMIEDGETRMGLDAAERGPYTPDDPYGDPYRLDPPASGAAWRDDPPASPPAGGGMSWLGNLRDSGAGEAAPPPPADPPRTALPATPPSRSAQAPNVGSWFDRLRGPDADVDLPAAQETTPPPNPPRTPAEAPPTSSWLSSLRAGSADAAPPDEAASRPATGPSWLQGLDDPPAAPPPMPSWAGLAPETTSNDEDSPPSWSITPASDLPSWASPAPTSPPDALLPSWLDAAGDTAPPAAPSWLAGLRPADPAPPPTPAPAAPDSHLPSWLAESDTPAPADSGPALPPWLMGLEEPAASVPPSPASPALLGEQDLAGEIELPAWLRAAGAAPPPPAMTGPRPFSGALDAALLDEESAALPPDADNLALPRLPTAVPSAPATRGADDGGLEFPSWMDAGTDAPAAPSSEAAPVPAQPAVSSEAAPVPAMPATAEDAPAIGLDLAYSERATPPAVTSDGSPVPPRTGRTGIMFPSWLEENATAEAPEEEAAAGEDLPSWLRALQPASVPAAPSVPTPAPASQGEELPDWLAALGVAHAQEEAPPVVEEALPMAAVPAARVVQARPPRPGAVDTFTRLLTPTVPVVVPTVARSRGAQMLAWLLPNGLAYALLLIASIGMWLAARNIAPDPALARVGGDVPAFHQLLIGTSSPLTTSSGLLPGFGSGLAAPAAQGITATPPITLATPLTATGVLSPALVVFDWDASRYGEMHELSLAVVRDLIAHQRPFVSVSLVPQGPGFADAVVAEASAGLRDEGIVVPDLLNDPASSPSSLYGRRYLNLGYRPGNEAAIRALVADPGGVNGIRGLDPPYDHKYQLPLDRWELTTRAPALSNYGLVVLLAGEEGNLRLWIEQLASQTAVPVVAAVPVSLRTVLAPYRDPALAKLTPARIQQALVGVQDAYALETARLGPPASGRPPTSAQVRLSRLLHAQAAALFAVALVLLLGFFAGIYGWLNRPRKT